MNRFASMVAKGLATALIVVGFGAAVYVFLIQTRYLQPDYRVPHPKSGRVVPYIFKGAIRYLTHDEMIKFKYGFPVGFALIAIGAYWRHGIERGAFWTRELFAMACFLVLDVVFTFQ